MRSVPAFVACGARSGSTLLRLLLDRHPDLTCPGETDLAVLVQSYVSIATGLSGEAPGAALHARAREVAEGLLAGHLARTGKARWCDKSLSNVFHLDLLGEVWPDARFVLLHRHCMDMVMSGLDASPWGLAEYGFAQLAQRSPTDSVVALAAYWVERTARLVEFEARSPERCLRVRYEDLVADPAAVLEGLWAHLGVAAHDVLGEGLAPPGGGRGPADHTIWYTDHVHGDAVGRGARVPPDHVTGPLRERVNELLAALGYEAVDDRWGSGRGTALDRAIGARLELRVVRGHEVRARHAVPDAAAAHGAPDPLERGPCVVAVEESALAGLASGGENLGAALRARSVRYYGPALASYEEERAVLERVRRFLRERAGD